MPKKDTNIDYEALIEKVNKKYKGDKTVPYMGNNSLPDPKSQYEYDVDRVNVIKKCHEDIKFFAENFFYIISAGKKQKIKLRDYQLRGLECFQNYNKTIFNTSRQIGKALALDTPIPTPSGWTTMGELKDGDIVYDENGNPCNVLHAHDIMYDRDCYEVEFDCGEKIIADGGHLWFTQSRTERNRGFIGSVKTTEDILKNIKFNHRIKKCYEVDNNTCDKTKYHYIKSIKKIDSVPVRCITVDSENSLYLCGKNYIPTHNTTLMGIYVVWLTTFFEYRQVLVVANKADTAKEILSRIKLAYEELPNWIKPGTTGWNKLSVEFKNGSTVKISATSADAARGSSLNCLVVDEAAHIEAHILEEFWSAVYPTISNDEDARILMSSTPNGVGNLFHELWEKSQEDNSSWGSLKVYWHEIDGRDESWAKDKRRDLGDEKFEQEYECKFLESGGSNIPEDLYNELAKGCIQPRIELTQFDGYKIYKEPNLEDRIYVAGVDIAEGVGECNSAIQILDVTDMSNIEQVAVYANNEVGPNEFARQLNEIMMHWGKPPLAIERNNTGGGLVIKAMDTEYHYPALVNFAFKQGRVDYGHLKGITSSTNTKYYGVMNMFYFLKTHRRVRLRDIKTLEELNTFVRHKNEKWARKSDSYYDDRVDALIWALICVHEAVAQQFFTVNMWDDNKKPFGLEPLYEIYGRGANRYRFGTEDNNWGVDKLVMPSGMGDPFIDEMNDVGWLLPEQDAQRGWRSYEPSPYQYLNK
jgi:hypothetical protein